MLGFWGWLWQYLSGRVDNSSEEGQTTCEGLIIIQAFLTTTNLATKKIKEISVTMKK